MKTKPKSIKKKVAVGAFLMASGNLDTGVRGGKQKLQKIVGKELFYQSEDGKKWFYNTEKLFKMPVSQIEKLTVKINGLDSAK